MIARRAAERSGGFLEYKPMYVAKIPIRITSDEKKSEIERMVTEVMKQRSHAKDTGFLEAEIDKLVYQIYGLGDKEIRSLEESLP